jgi:peroxiredoxin/Spy/CpxP family protein refolding chaperone
MKFICAPLLASLALLAPACGFAAPVAEADPGADAGPKSQPLFDPIIPLLRDDTVRTALALTPEQRTSIDELFGKHNRMLLAIRDVGPTGADKTAQPALKEIRDALETLLRAEQRVRLQGLVLQAQGYDSLLRKDIAALLKLTPDQQKQLAEISADFHEQVKALQKSADPNRSAETQRADLARLQSDRQQRIVAQLTPEQRTRYGELLGEPFGFDNVRPSPADAPEFTGIEAWLNSEPLTMQSLRGKVVVVHFFAFGCSNCINNYPWYREWRDAFQGQDVVLIGIHTPETQAETDNEQLRLSLAKHQLKFPVAVDKDKKMWQAWYNGIWPSVYLVDKQGRVRTWWYGELDWQGAGGQKIARQQIERLLAEADPATTTLGAK